jgi:hypothetical protein
MLCSLPGAMNRQSPGRALSRPTHLTRFRPLAYKYVQCQKSTRIMLPAVENKRAIAPLACSCGLMRWLPWLPRAGTCTRIHHDAGLHAVCSSPATPRPSDAVHTTPPWVLGLIHLLVRTSLVSTRSFSLAMEMQMGRHQIGRLKDLPSLPSGATAQLGCSSSLTAPTPTLQVCQRAPLQHHAAIHVKLLRTNSALAHVHLSAIQACG